MIHHEIVIIPMLNPLPGISKINLINPFKIINLLGSGRPFNIQVIFYIKLK